MHGLSRLIAVLIGLAALSAAPAEAKRVALVVGINTYDNLKPDQQLHKAVNDARAIATTLKEVGFQVMIAEDATRSVFLRTWQRFLDTVKPGDVTTVYFAGHGVELNGANFVLARDVPQPDEGEEVMRGSAIRVGSLMDRLRAQNPQVAVWIIDACRDNPYAGSSITRSVGTTRGLRREEPPRGTLVMMSAGTGQGALDALSPGDNNPNSVYTRTLLPLLKEPGLEITDLAKRVRSQVETLASTIRHEQRPAFYHELSGNFFLVPSATPDSPAAGPASPSFSEVAQAWTAAKDSTNPAILEALIRQFNGTFYASLAQTRLDELKKPPERPGVPAVIAMAPASPPAAAAASPQLAPLPSNKPPSAMESAQAWLAVKDATEPKLIEVFLQRHGDSIYADQARAKLAALRDGTKRVAVVPSIGPAAPSAATPAVGIFPQARSVPLNSVQERALKPEDTFKECAKCPEMVVLPPGSFTMGSPDSEQAGRGTKVRSIQCRSQRRWQSASLPSRSMNGTRASRAAL